MMQSRIGSRPSGMQKNKPLNLEKLETRALLTLLVDIGDPDCQQNGPIYCQISDAVEAAKSGDRIEVAAGTYERLTVDVDGITISEATEDANPIIDANQQKNGLIIASDNVTILGLEVRNSRFNGFHVDGNDNVLRGNVGRDSQGAIGLMGDRNTIENNYAHVSILGFQVLGTDNRVIGNVAEGPARWGGFIIDRANEVIDNQANNTEGFGFAIADKANGSVFRGNTATGNKTHGFMIVDTAEENLFENNRAIGNGVLGFEARNMNNQFTDNVCLENDGGFDNHDGAICRVVGDVTGDGRFDSSDVIAVFKVGEYDDGIPGNSTYEEGDWNNDGDFDSSDLVYAFSNGNYLDGPSAARSSLAAAIDQFFNDKNHQHGRN